ncbi:MAG: autotransporter-associated beta strand repeat-containing protein [Verrucomicrobiaceae bacterium]|nr:autotransporter-associated beta strand repeat-containing protein [Verrucomicrobiaceae bacterium]
MSRHVDSGFRATALSLQGGAIGTGTTFRTPLGSGTVDVFGEVRIEGSSGTAVTTGGTTNANTWVFHPGSRIRFNNGDSTGLPFTGSGTTGTQAAGTIGGGGRWADTVGITLDGAVLDLIGDNSDHAANKEIIGDLTVGRGAEVVVRRNTGFGAELITSNLFRGTTTSTLMLRHDTDLLGDAGSVNTDRFIVSSGIGTTAGQVPVTNNMVDPWIVSRSQNQFLKYDATLGFQLITEGAAPSNYITSAGGTLTMAANNGTEILNLGTATATLGANLDIHALRVDRDINVSADGQFKNIIIRSGGLMQAANTPTINADLYFGSAGDGTGQALIWANNNTLQINGKIFASEVVKSGTSFLNVRSDQPQFTGDWIINGGGIQFLTPNAASTGEVILNAGHMVDNDTTYNITEVRYNYNSGTPDLFTWNGGKITGYNTQNRIYLPMASDRLQQIPDVDLRTTNTVPGVGQEGSMIFLIDGYRSTARTGTVTLYDHYMVQVESNTFGTGSTSGFQFGSGEGVSGLNNGGLYDLRKIGDGVLTLGDNTASFTGSRTITVGEGAVRAIHNGAFGGAGNTLKVNSTGVLEVAVAGFAPTATLTMDPGSAERWAVDGARSGNYTLPQGVSLQVMHNQTGTQTITLNGGSIMGYLPRDWEQVAVIHTLGSGVTINLTGDSFLGQPYATSSNGVWDLSGIYDQGKINTTTGSNPSDPALRGSYLQIDGAITGSGGITKLGQDIILLNGANTYTGATRIENGILQLGRDNALPTTTSLEMASTSGMLDLNGNDQEVAALSGAGGSVNNGAFDNNTFTVNQASSTIYGGTIDGNITVHKKGAGELTFTPVTPTGDTTAGNGYRGGTVFEAGKIAIAQDTALGWQQNAVDADNLRFTGGTLHTTASLTLHANRGVQLDAAGGTIETDAATTTQVAGIATGVGGLTKTGSGILQLNHVGNDYSGNTNVAAGTMQGGAANTLSENSRHVVTGDTVSGTLAVNGFNQVIGSLSSTGLTPANAVVAFTGAEILTVGNDRTKDAVYAGAITGAGTFRVNGNGAVQTLSTFDNSAATWNTEIANGVLNVAEGAKLGASASAVQLGVAGVTGADDYTALNLQNTPTFTNNIVVTTENSVGSAAITSTVANSNISGTVTLNRDIFAGAGSIATGEIADTQLSLTNTVSGDGRITVIDGGALRLTTANTYGAGAFGFPSDDVNGGTIIRAGSVLLENSTAAGVKVIEIGDTTSTIGAAVDRATFDSILGSGTWNPNGDGVSSTTGGQDATATTGHGAFMGVSSTIDGFTYTAPGARILITGEEANPERNGIYTIVSVSGSTMNLVRADDFETSNQMRYGGQVAVTNGTYAGQTMFMFEENIVVRNETTQEPIRFREDVLNPNLALLQNVSGLTVANHIDVNATNGTGTITIGGSSLVTSGTGTFSGFISLRDVIPNFIETKTVILTSSTADGNGISFTGMIGEAGTNPGVADVLSINKIDAGTVTLEAANPYVGTTTVTAGTLQVGTGGTAATRDAGSTGTGATTVNAGALLIGSGTVNGIAGTTTHVLNGTLAPGDFLAAGTDPTGNGTLDVTGSLDATAGTIRLTGSQETYMDTTLATNIANGTWVIGDTNYVNHLTSTAATNDALATGAARPNHDLVNISNQLTLTGSSLVSLTFLSGYTPVGGEWFDLLDWGAISATGFDAGGTANGGTFTRNGGLLGDLELPTLSAGLLWDVSLLSTNGILVVVPEPSRALLMLLGLLGLALRRRRSR